MKKKIAVGNSRVAKGLTMLYGAAVISAVASVVGVRLMRAAGLSPR